MTAETLTLHHLSTVELKQARAARVSARGGKRVAWQAGARARARLRAPRAARLLRALCARRALSTRRVRRARAANRAPRLAARRWRLCCAECAHMHAP
jgi:hypothetical protein